ncbi:hypothetical protein B0T09DRAFT_26883 [Sordaria sp. MPI-SDFR-AT-0083]|nr:hypothetical protein B0T09DRAFT_26883 [Sordaria sp. MPI-SDFR-AT-0083]
MTGALPRSSKRRSGMMGVFCCLPTRRQRHLQVPRGQAMSQPLPLYHDDDPREKSQPDLSSPNPWLQPNNRPTSSASWASYLTSASTPPSPSPSPSNPTTPIDINARFASCTNHLDQIFGIHYVPTQISPPCPTRRPPPPQTSETAPPPLYTALSTSADMDLPSYADVLGRPSAVRATPREAPPSFEAAKIQEHEEGHGDDPFRWPGCEYCRVYSLWVCYWRGGGEVRG